MPRIPVESNTATTVVVEGKPYLAFGGCSYLGLSHHADVIAAMRNSLDRFGISTSASRETTGDTAAHDALEDELAKFLRADAGLVVPEGYTANLALAQAVTQQYRVALIDEKSHRSVAHAVTAAGLQVHTYRHLDAEHATSLARTLDRDQGVVIWTDGVFAADGAVAPLDKLFAALPARGLLVVDDCHGFCVLGTNGRGTLSWFGLDAAATRSRVCITTTLAKGLGCYGGAIVGSRSLITLAQETASVYRGTTACPPPIVEAAREALRVIQREPQLVTRLSENIEAMHAALSRCGVTCPRYPTPVFTFVLDSETRMAVVHRMMLDAGVLAPLIEYPGGPTARYFRLSVNARHSAADIARLEQALAAALMATEPKTMPRSHAASA
ncbi:MAG: pyridoxal phosphate-dependent aminotransferase family protein [Planctomycetota bacterium]|nr:pyridoxal phosphate-dependent aminotransferase family protein [Planctomycetota bacterium]